MKKDEKNMETADTMSDELMNNLLAELGQMIHWQAILKLITMRDLEAINTLVSIDGFKEPTLLARTQGMRVGFYHLKNYVEEQVRKRSELVEEQKK